MDQKNNMFEDNRELIGNISSSSLNNCTISKRGRVLMIIVLFCSLFIFLANFLTSMDWYWELQINAVMYNDSSLKEALDVIPDLIEVINWTIVLIITIVSFIFYRKDKKQLKNIKVYSWYIVAGLLHIFLGAIGLTLMIYIISTLLIVKETKKDNNSNGKTDNFIIIFSRLSLFIILFVFIGVQTNLFDKIADKIEQYQNNKEVIIEDADDGYTVTSFDNIVKDWGDDISQNKSFKIKNVKLKNIIAALYVDYVVENKEGNYFGKITFTHGDEQIYSYADEYKSFNLTFFGQYKDLILFGSSYCDDATKGLCEQHLTYSKVVAFNSLDLITLYDSTIHGVVNGVAIVNEISMFMEDKNVYTTPYNDFRVYDIKIKGNGVYFYTLVENYSDLFEKDFAKYSYDCNNQFWITSNFDLQRTYKVDFVYDDLSKLNEVDNLYKIDNIQYEDYCYNRSVLEIN